MEKILETPQANTTVIQESKISQEELKPQTNSISETFPADSRCKSATTPDRLKVPKAFKYPERYTSPTDLMMSPVSRGLVARTRKPNGLLPPPKIQQPKLQIFRHQEAGLFQC